MLNKEMVQFFESILEERSDEFRVTESDLVSPSAFEKKQAKIRRKVVELLRLGSLTLFNEPLSYTLP